MINQHITVLDFETSGLDAGVDRVIEMAAVRFYKGEIITEFNTLVKFDGELSPKITEVTGIKQSDLEFALDEITAFRILNRIIGSSIIVAHNATFDLGFLHQALMRFAGRTFNNDFIDTLAIARSRYSYPHTLTEMSDRLGVELNGAHRALNDVIACYEVLKKMHEKEPVDNFLNKLTYKAKYGKPKWVPEKATLIAH